ncbi:MAG TPA: L-rhamnose/proton symporter RhaT [Candidatus Sulfotelmatobacter sp.]|nr:L-rhamnose/proton symporter RhaT [Candidatus Sulfotelmatobacter sp.]
MSPLSASILFHAIGAACAAVCYVPQKSARGWSWQSFWLMQAAFCWFLLPVAGAFLTVPDYSGVLREIWSTHDGQMVLLRTFLLGAAYGIGGTAFGVAIRYVGFSVTYAMAIGISMVFGTAYAIAKGDTSVADFAAHFQSFFAKTGAHLVVSGMGIGLVGIVFCGLAGRMKENDHTVAKDLSGSKKAVIGIFLCVLAGLLSAVYSMALAEGAPIAKIAADRAAGHLVLGIDAATFSSNAIYPFSNAGAFLTTAIYCLWLHARHKTLGEIVNLPEGGERASLPLNWAMAILTGCLWYGQFFFYGFGHFYIQKAAGFEQMCWAIHMILLILLGTFVGIIFKEWKNCQSRTYAALTVSIALLIAGKLVLDYGNYLGIHAAK